MIETKLDFNKAYSVQKYGNVAWQILGYDTEYEEETWVLSCCNSPDSAYFDGDADAYDPDTNDCDHATEMCWIYGESELVQITDRVQCVMIGDDRKYVFYVDELEPISDDEYCHGCGQIGCGH